MPTDPGTIDYNDQELSETLGVILNVLESNQSPQVILTGDFNSDFNRNTGHVNDVKTFVENAALNLSWSRFHVDFTHVTVRNDVIYTHTLDHFFWGEDTANDIIDAGGIHHVDNDSDYEFMFKPKIGVTQSYFLHIIGIFILPFAWRHY